jgi:signal transduction histidine kinase
MESLLWHLTNRTAETLLILNLFHLLLAGLALLVLVHQGIHRGAKSRADRLLRSGFSLLVLHFALLTVRFGMAFFLREQLRLAGLERVSHGLLVAGVLAIVLAYVEAAGGRHRRWVAAGFAALVVLTLVDVAASATPLAAAPRPHSAAMLISDLIAVLALWLGIWVVARGQCAWEGRRAWLLALVCLVAVFVLHGAPSFVSRPAGTVVWNLEEHLMSLALFGFTWAVGERSQNLLDRVFVRLNLTFIILASLIMLTTAGMEKYQYFRLAEERSVNLAEFLRGHLLYYSAQGETLEQIFSHPEVLRRVVTEFGTLPELREVDIYAKGQRVGFRYQQDWEVKETITPDEEKGAAPDDQDLRNTFQMIRLPIGDQNPRDRIEFVGTMDYVNAYIGKYIIFIYCVFTVMLGIGTLVIGMIVADTDRQLKRRYAELQEAQQQLAQAAKLASIGELAGGMAHEINNPITSILALSSHMADGDNAGVLNSRGRKNLQLIVRQAERVASLVGGLLTFSRQSQLQVSRVNLGELLETALDLVQYRLKDGAIRVRREIEPGLPWVQGDASRLTEVFVNLLCNAIDAMPGGGTLQVRAAPSPADGTVRIEVQDTGEGIAAEHLTRIFDPFFTTKAPGRGTGLGLSISHGIIKDHGGEIWARSEPGKGTTLVVSFSPGADSYEPAYSGN